MKRVAALLAAIVVLASCRGASETDTAPPAPVERIVSKGPVTLVARLDRDEIAVGAPLALTLEATAETGVTVEMPKIGETLGPFEVTSARTPPDVPVDGRRRWVHDFTLETFESGDLEVPALVAGFTDARADEPIDGELTVDAIPVRVASVLGAVDLAAAVELRDAVPVPVERPFPWTAVVVAALIVAGTIAAILIVRARRGGTAPVGAALPPAHVWALDALDRLEARRLVEDGRIREFYVGLTGIVREYIERRFAVHAPERTTDEFLREAQRHPVLGGHHRDALGEFLRSADMVKFARYRPERAEIDEAAQSARRFVQETAEKDADLGAAA